MDKFSLASFLLGLLALVNLSIMLLGVNLDSLNLATGAFTIIFYLPILGIILGFVSFFQKLDKKELIFSVLGITLALILYFYLFYLIIDLAKGLSNF